jgi:hypothetical protein
MPPKGMEHFACQAETIVQVLAEGAHIATEQFWK